MKNGTVEVSEDDKTWENLRSAGKDWKTIFSTIDMGHMALLRNLRNVFEEVDDIEFCKEYVAKLKDTVISGKQFPFRYYTAIEAVKKSRCNHQPIIIDALEDWDLWIRFSLKYNFHHIEKTTSLYRVPFNPIVTKERQEFLDSSLKYLKDKHKNSKVEINPFDIFHEK
jgi:hypothetical protein